MKIEKIERNFVVKTNFGKIVEVFETRADAESFMKRKIEEDRIAELDRFRWWKCSID